MRRKIAGKMLAWKEDGGGGAAGREDALRDGIHIPELQASHLHRPMKNERARSAFDGDLTVDTSSIDRLNGTFG